MVCGITSLDLDHTSILGKTIESIAWNKAGIMKPGVPTFTMDQPFRAAVPVLMERAKEKQVLYITYGLKLESTYFQWLTLPRTSSLREWPRRKTLQSFYMSFVILCVNFQKIVYNTVASRTENKNRIQWLVRIF